MSKAADIKNKIKDRLTVLKQNETIAEFIVDDFKKGIFERDYGRFPVAILTTPSITNDYLTNSQDIRTYTYEIIVISRGEDVNSETQIEELAEAIMDDFDNLPSLGGTADGGLEPSSSPAEAVTSRSGTYIVFSVILKARAVKDLTL